MKFRHLWLVPLFAALSVTHAAAQKPFWVFENHGYYDPILADPRATQTTVLFPAVADSFPFAVNEGKSLVWDISLGSELPIFGFSTKRGSESPTGVAAGAFGLGVWLPIGFHMIEDLNKDDSSPVLNTDYRFAALVKAQWGLPDDAAWWSSAHVGVKLQCGHESTHLGDEFTLGAMRVHSVDFIRVNVSYEYCDLGGAFEPNVGKDGRYQIKIRAGNIWLWRPEKGWYGRALLQPFGQFIAGSERNHEPYFQFEIYRQPGGSNLGLILSADIRDKTIYQYAAAPDENQTNPSEPTEWSTNVMVGVRQVRTGSGMLGKLSPTYFLRVYHGVNPNGQFRSQSGFDEIGFGIHFGF